MNSSKGWVTLEIRLLSLPTTKKHDHAYGYLVEHGVVSLLDTSLFLRNKAAVHVKLSQRFRIEAAHHLPCAPEGHKCRRLHGHSYVIDLVVEGEVNPAVGWLIDYAHIKEAFAPLYEKLDHHYLNEVEDLENPTSENLARWIWQRLIDKIPLSEIRIDETCTSSCIYHGD